MKKRLITFGVCLLLFVAMGMGTAAEEVQTEGVIEPDAGIEGVETNVDGAVEETITDAETSTETDAEAEGAGLPTTMEGWEVYIKEEIIPVVVFIVSSVAAVYVAILPVLTSVKKASEKFKSATKDVNKAASETEQNKNDIAALGAKMDTISAEFAAIKTGLKNVQTISKIGFGNFTELIEKGYAHEIEKVGESENEEETL